MPPTPNEVSALIRKILERQAAMEKRYDAIADQYHALIQACENQPRSISQEIDSIPGRRIFYSEVGSVAFTAAQNGLKGTPVNMPISQDGPFIATHYPIFVWKPNAPSTATNLGMWSPVASWPLPTQQRTNQDGIDLSYDVVDGGSQRNFQNESVPPIMSRPDNLVPLPVPTLFAPNSVIQITPTYERIFFDPDPAVPTTGGVLKIAIPGYRIVNL